MEISEGNSNSFAIVKADSLIILLYIFAPEMMLEYPLHHAVNTSTEILKERLGQHNK